MTLTTNFFNLLHGFIVAFPVLIYIIPVKFLIGWYHYVMWTCLMVPLHWPLFDNKCLITIASQKTGDFKNSTTSAPFIEKYFKGVYEPIMNNIFNLEWNDKDIHKMLHIHWMVNFTLMWYHMFYIYSENCHRNQLAITNG